MRKIMNVIPVSKNILVFTALLLPGKYHYSLLLNKEKILGALVYSTVQIFQYVIQI